MLTYRIGLLGSPAQPEIEWTDKNLEELKALGFQAMQINIAWGCRPNGEPLNMEDVVITPDLQPDRIESVTYWQNQMKHRIALCKKHDMRVIFHFGAPFNGHAGYMEEPLPNCISDPSLTQKYIDMLGMLNSQLPGIDDILLYTFDQDAWFCSEFVRCDNCFGKPLHTRIVPFLNALCSKWRQMRPDGRLWWEPWELSAGQVLRIIGDLPAEGFGLMLHSNIGEVQKTRPVDLWLRNTVRMAKMRGIPVVVELFMAQACEETEPLTNIPTPQLTYSQIHAVTALDGVVGVKEYYGLVPGIQDPCLAMAGEVFHDFYLTLEEALDKIASPYGDRARAVKALWETVSEGYMLFPFDASWWIREVGKADIDHGWHAAFIRGQQCSSPSWDSSRHAIFMVTDDNAPHPSMMEDVQLRCELAGDKLAQAVTEATAILPHLSGLLAEQMDKTVQSVDYFSRVCYSYALHLRETNVAMMLRILRDKGDPLRDDLLSELRQLLKRDVENQQGKGVVCEVMRALEEDAEKWLDTYLLPTSEALDEKGRFSVTSR